MKIDWKHECESLGWGYWEGKLKKLISSKRIRRAERRFWAKRVTVTDEQVEKIRRLLAERGAGEACIERAIQRLRLGLPPK